MANNRRIKREILDLLLNEHLRLTPIHLERAVCSKVPKTTKRLVRSAVKALLVSGQLTYTQHFSTTHLEINYNRPVRISHRILITPSRFLGGSDPNQIEIRMNDGSSFGAGDHPTTRMLLRGMDDFLRSKKGPFLQALDIGTGSGLLAIAAAAMGVECVEGIDIDRVACHEACQNVSLNGLEKAVTISRSTLDDFQENQFDLILANLRPPTIRELIPEMKRVSSHHAVWMISGCRMNERSKLENLLTSECSEVIWQEDQNNWSAFAVKMGFGLK